MGLCGPLRELTDFVDEIERGAGRVRSVEFPTRLAEGDELSTEIEVTFPLRSMTEDGNGLVLRSADIEPDGSVRIGLESSTPVLTSKPSNVENEIVGMKLQSDYAITIEFFVSISTETTITETDHPRSARSPTPTHTDLQSQDKPAVSVNKPPSEDCTDRSQPGSDRDVPPFEDREHLTEVYESSGTFAEMAEVIEMDVTAETVRRYMIDHGIHEPTSYNRSPDIGEADSNDVDDDGPADAGKTDATDVGDADATDVGDADATDVGDADATDVGDADATDVGDADDDNDVPDVEPDSTGLQDEDATADTDDDTTADTDIEVHEEPTPTATSEDPPVALGDGIGLSKDVDIDTLIEAVRKSKTIYEVQREIGLDREEAVETLQKCNLLDFVVGRLAADGPSEVTREEVIAQLRAGTAGQ